MYHSLGVLIETDSPIYHILNTDFFFGVVINNRSREAFSADLLLVKLQKLSEENERVN